jgi:hypothetical protein
VAWWALGTTRTCWRMVDSNETPRRSSNDETIMEEKSNDGKSSTWMNGMEESNTLCPGTKMEGGAVSISAISSYSDANIFFVFLFWKNKDDNDFPQLSQSATVPANAVVIIWMNFMVCFCCALGIVLSGFFAIGGVCFFL